MPARAIHKQLKSLVWEEGVYERISIEHLADAIRLPVAEMGPHLEILKTLGFIHLEDGKVQLTETGYLANLE